MILDNILLTGLSVRSLGGYAMLRSAIKLLHKNNYHYTLLSYYFTIDQDILISSELKNLVKLKSNIYFGINNIDFKIDIVFMIIDYILLFFTSKAYFLSKYTKEVKRSEAIWEIHGISFSKQYGFNDAFTSFLKISIAYRLKKPYYCLPQSYGPLTNKFLLMIAKQSLNKTSLICPRGNISIEFLNKLNLKHNRIRFTPDLAFAFENPDRKSVV